MGLGTAPSEEDAGVAWPHAGSIRMLELAGWSGAWCLLFGVMAPD